MDFSNFLYSSTALFLDFDGTLVDIAEQPHEVAVPRELVSTLGLLNEYLGGAVAVISGRPITQIDDFLRPLQLAAAGVHGAERRSATGELTLLSAPALDVVEQAARKLAGQNAGLLVESKRGSLALHYQLHAVAPLVVTTLLLTHQGTDLTQTCDAALARVVAFAVNDLDSGAATRAITGEVQSYFDGTDTLEPFNLAWIEAYLRLPDMPDREALDRLAAGYRPLGYSKLGGNQSLIWQHLP